MKGGMDKFCASQAATAICHAMEKGSSSSMLLGSGGSSPAIDRYNPIIRDPTRTVSNPLLIPKPHHKKAKKKFPLNENGGHQCKENGGSGSVELDDEKKAKIASQGGVVSKNGAGRKSWSCTRPGDFISPPGSARYLLSDKVYFNPLSDFNLSLKLHPAEASKAAKEDEPRDAQPHPSASVPNQVVVLRVSLHCRGCEKKMRKHISRMEGVTSFSIDFAAKKVTVSGNITPLEVLSSISKVKNAQLWSPSASGSSESIKNGFNGHR